MTALSRLSRFGSTVKERALPIWKSAGPQFERGLQWLKLRPRVVFWVGGISIALIFLVFSGATAAGAALLAWAALGQAATASDRHQEQTNADRQRRVTESFSRAVEQLGSDKLEVRLGGIYSLERISKESPDDYWTVMENLTAFVRERSRRNKAERAWQDEQRISHRAYFLWQGAGQPDGRAEDFWADAVVQEEFGEPPAADIAAVLTVIMRRDWERENTNAAWRLDLSGAILNQAELSLARLNRADLRGAHLEWADLRGAHLDGAGFFGARLNRANLFGAHLNRADLNEAHLYEAVLRDAYLERAVLRDAHLERANVYDAHLEGADLFETHLEGADLRAAVGLSQAQLALAHGNAQNAPSRWASAGALAGPGAGPG